MVTLDGTQSSDVDGDSLTYQWTIDSKPENSQSTLSNPTSATPQLTVDVIGLYIIKLVISDGESKSKPDFVTVFVTNEKPVANIIEDSIQTGAHHIIGDTIQLNASQSFDPDGQNLTYRWNLTIKPDGSNTELSGTTIPDPSFTVDSVGHYIIHLTVNDGFETSAPKIILFEIEPPGRKSDTRPFAEAGVDQAIFSSNTIIRLDGSKSYDVENDTLNYHWEIIYQPDESNAKLNLNTIATPEFVADVFGSYVIKLVVSDINGESHLDTVVITTHDNSSLYCGDCHIKPESHFIVYDDCVECHGTARHGSNNWQSIGEISHAHGQVARPAQCDICHNGIDAKGKPENHKITDKDCNYCHIKNIGPWKRATSTPVELDYDHKGIFNNCTLCHNDQFQQGKPAGHMPVSDRCLACHTTEQWASETHLEHTNIFNICIDCHNGFKASGKSEGHISTQQNCIQCHQKNSWKQTQL